MSDGLNKCQYIKLMSMHSAEEMEEIGEDIGRLFVKLNFRQKIIVSVITATSIFVPIFIFYTTKIQ